MKFTYNWLKDYVDINLKPQELAEKLTMAGLEIEAVSQSGDDWVFDAEVTTNRPDWLSIIGIAREVAAVTGTSLLAPKEKPASPAGRHKPVPAKLSIEIKDNIACPRYTGRIINNIKVAPSPEWLQKRLKSIGLRPVNNVVDITNFILFETGQPLHAFDFDKLSGAKIIVRRAKANEEIVCIDGIKRKLSPDMLVIADENSPVAIAGIMGSRDTQVTESTKTILLESAYFNPIIIRKVSKALGLSSDSSYRFERGVNFAVVKTASDRAADLIIKHCSASAGSLIDSGKNPSAARKVSLRPKRLNSLLGIDVSKNDISRILRSLGLILKSSGKAKLVFDAPSWRQDIKKEIDLIEEIARIYGYDKIPARMPKEIETQERVFLPEKIEFHSLIRDTLVSFGLNEVLTYSLVDKTIDSLFQPEAAGIAVKNPLSPELGVLRTNLLSGILLSAKWNLNRNISGVKLFEIGPAYLRSCLDKEEEFHLAICSSGIRSDNWQDGARPADFYYLKGIIEALFLRLGIKDCQINHSQNNILSPAESAEIKTEGETVGFLGKVKKELLGEIDIDKDCFICQLNLDKLIIHATSVKRFFQLPKFPAVYRDISTLAKQDISSGEIVNIIKASAANIVKDVKLFDVYRGRQIPEGYKSLVYRLTYQSTEKTLTDSEVETANSKIIIALKEKLGVGIR